MMLAQLLASMKDGTGRVTIAGFYDDVVPLSPAERRAIAAAPVPDATLMARARPRPDRRRRRDASPSSIHQPSLDINGMRSADVGAAGAQRHPVDRDRDAST